MKTPIFFVSDNHFQKKSDSLELERKRKFYNLLDHIKNSGGSVVIGGDFFDFWFDYKYVVPKEYNDILFRLEQLYHSGIKIPHGNDHNEFRAPGCFNAFIIIPYSHRNIS